MTTLDNRRYHAVEDEIATAAIVLGSFIEHAAITTADEIGFGYELVPDAPSTYAELLAAFQRSVAPRSRQGRAPSRRTP